jgi:hypothetical protein
MDDIHDYLVLLEDELELEYDVHQKLEIRYEKSKEGDIYYEVTIEIIDIEEPDLKTLIDKSDYLQKRSQSAKLIHDTISRINDSLGITLIHSSSLSDEVMKGRYIFRYSEESNNLKQKFIDWISKRKQKKGLEIENIISRVPGAEAPIGEILGRFDDLGIKNPENYFTFMVKNGSVTIYGLPSDPLESVYIIFDCPISEMDKWKFKFLELDTFTDDVRWTK